LQPHCTRIPPDVSNVAAWLWTLFVSNTTKNHKPSTSTPKTLNLHAQNPQPPRPKPSTPTPKTLNPHAQNPQHHKKIYKNFTT